MENVIISTIILFLLLFLQEFGALQYRKFAYLVEQLKDRFSIIIIISG